MGIMDSLGKTNAVWASNANVSVKLGDGNTQVNVAAKDVAISLGDGNQDANIIATNNLLFEAGDGLDNINAKAGNDAAISVGFDNSNIELIAGGSAFIDTECGNQTITATAGKDLVIDTGCCGEDNIVARAGGDAIINTAESNDNVYLEVGGNFAINAGTTDPETEDCDNDTVFVRSYSTEGGNYVSTGNGNDQIAIIANNTVVDKNEGEMLLGILGNVAQVNSQAEKNTIGGYGDNYEFNLRKDADNDVRTMDFWVRDGQDGKKVMLNDGSMVALKDLVDDVDKVDGYTLTEYDAKNNAYEVNFFKNTFGTMFDTMTKSEDTSEVIGVRVDITGMSKEQIAEKYNLSDEEKANLEKADLTAMDSYGQPLYAIIKSPKKSAKAGKDVYVVVKRDAYRAGEQDYWHGRAVSDGECIACNFDGCGCGCKCGEEKIEGKKITTTTYADMQNWTTWGVANWAINLTGEKESGCGCGCGCGEENRFGSLMANISARGGYVSIDGQDVDTENDITNINIIGGHRDSILTKCWDKTVEDWALSIFSQRESWNSPLILDMNGDGKISSQAGIGVDIDGDGKADGAASDGDKMLAMSDMNNDGQIGGTEVFGNNTVSPFTGKKLNAANGFEALKLIAKEAEAKGYKCMNGTEVDIAALAVALEKEAGVKLGFISGANATQLEDLTGVKTINTQYVDTTLESGAQRQHGFFTRENGEIALVDDVWFKNNK